MTNEERKMTNEEWLMTNDGIASLCLLNLKRSLARPCHLILPLYFKFEELVKYQQHIALMLPLCAIRCAPCAMPFALCPLRLAPCPLHHALSPLPPAPSVFFYLPFIRREAAQKTYKPGPSDDSVASVILSSVAS